MAIFLDPDFSMGVIRSSMNFINKRNELGPEEKLRNPSFNLRMKKPHRSGNHLYRL
jgi:hypothetical protein